MDPNLARLFTYQLQIVVVLVYVGMGVLGLLLVQHVRGRRLLLGAAQWKTQWQDMRQRVLLEADVDRVTEQIMEELQAKEMEWLHQIWLPHMAQHNFQELDMLAELTDQWEQGEPYDEYAEDLHDALASLEENGRWWKAALEHLSPTRPEHESVVSWLIKVYEWPDGQVVISSDNEHQRYDASTEELLWKITSWLVLDVQVQFGCEARLMISGEPDKITIYYEDDGPIGSRAWHDAARWQAYIKLLNAQVLYSQQEKGPRLQIHIVPANALLEGA